MTDNEIIEALKRCPQHTECCYCNSLEECGNKRILTTSVFDLIKRQKAEIESLEKELMKCKLEKELLYNVSVEKQNIAIKEFAERLKEKLQWDVEFDNKLVFESDLDSLVKEITEER